MNTRTPSDAVMTLRGRRIAEVLKLQHPEGEPYVFATTYGNKTPKALFTICEELLSGYVPNRISKELR